MAVIDNPSQPISGRQSAKRRILIVDDNRDAAKTLSMLLEMTGYETFTANDGITAVDVACESRPDIILMDLGLPRMNGHEACRKIRDLTWGMDVTIIAVTGWGQDKDREESGTAGFDRHLVKPVSLETLQSTFAEFSGQFV